MQWLFGDPHTKAKRLILRLTDARKAAQAEAELLEMGVEAVPALVEALHSASEESRREVAKILVKMGNLATPLLISQLNTTSPSVQQQICQIFARTRAKEALPALLGALRHPNVEVRMRASDAIGSIGDASILPSLMRLARDENPQVRASAARTMGYFPQSTPNLVELLLYDPEIEVREAAAHSLARLRDPASLPALIEALQDSRWWYEREQKQVEALLNAILAFGTQAVEPLIALLEHREGTVRKFAAFLLGKIRDRRALPALEITLYDLHFEVGEAAAQALIQFGTEGRDILLMAQRHPEAPVRERVVRALAQISDSRVTSMLIEFLQDPDENVRIQAIQILAKRKEKDALPALQVIAADRSNRRLAEMARVAIIQITS